MKTSRITICPKDIQRLTGKSDRYGRTLLNKMREHFNKERHQYITIEEFCAYTGLNLEQVHDLLTA